MIPNTVKKIIKEIYGILILEDIILHRHRRTLLKFFEILTLLAFLGMLILGEKYFYQFKGLFFVFAGVTLMLVCLEAYFFSFYKRSHYKNHWTPFEVGTILYYSEEEDITKGFIFSDIGDETLRRLGVTEGEIKEFLETKNLVRFEDIFENQNTGEEAPNTVTAYAALILKYDKQFDEFLFKKGVRLDEVAGALEWVVGRARQKIEKEMWWSKENLMRMPSLGKNWSFGETFTLEKYGEDITEGQTNFLDSFIEAGRENVEKLEEMLSQNKGSNIIITSDDESSRMDVVSMLAEKMVHNEALMSLTHKRIYLLQSNLIIGDATDKISFENIFMNILFQAMQAQNVILVIPYFSSFVKSAENLGSNVPSILSPYLDAPTLHIIALDSKTDFHSFLESKEGLMEHFEILKVEGKSSEGVLSILKKEADMIEKTTTLFITYPALVEIAESSKKYFDAYAYADKAKDLLLQSVPYALSRGIKILLAEHITTLVSSRTGIPAGAPKGEEKEKLLNLEKILHEKIIGQEEAVLAISESMRRNRAGVGNPGRPIGSFLFLGPTGVGKTETTKALAEIFFGSTEKMSRLDMSEYRGADSIERLLGSFGAGKAGILSSLVREKPYGVLLLDEFEKTNKDVLNLFLRILDEGIFSDAEGKEVNIKNNIIIATSNAGSDLIWDSVKAGENLQDKKESIIDEIIGRDIFKPELLNRFDGVILFHPLTKEDLKKIAGLMMGKLSKRMMEKNISIEINDVALEYLASKGSDPKFGARPLNREIQEKIEGEIAKKIIEGGVVKGSRISFEIGEDGGVKIISL